MARKRRAFEIGGLCLTARVRDRRALAQGARSRSAGSASRRAFEVGGLCLTARVRDRRALPQGASGLGPRASGTGSGS